MGLSDAPPFVKCDRTDKLLPDLLEEVASLNPDYPAVHILNEDETTKTFITVTHLQLLTTARELSQRMRSLIPGRGLAEEPIMIGLLAHSSFHYFATVIAMLINRWTPILLSQKNSVEGTVRLLTISKAEALFVEPSLLSFANDVKSEKEDLRLYDLSALPEHILELLGEPCSTDQIDMQMELDRPCLCLHTSGSTDLPKLVPWTHRFMLAMARKHEYDQSIPHEVYAASPIYHAIGMIYTFPGMLSIGDVCIFVRTRVPPNGESLLRYIEPFQNPIVVTAPAILDEIYRMGPNAIAQLAKTSCIVYGGAPLRKEVGDHLAQQGIKLVNCYGATEIGGVTRTGMEQPLEDWRYACFEGPHDIEMRDMEDGTFEAIIKTVAGVPPAVCNETDPPAYATNDLFRPHPQNTTKWLYAGRKDDITVLSNGLKVGNKEIETALTQDPLISAAVVFGTDRLLIGVLLEARGTWKQPSDLIKAILSSIEAVNKVMPRHSIITEGLILVGDAHRPFPRTDKGTIRAKHVIRDYEREICHAYEDLGKCTEVPVPHLLTADTVGNYVRTSIQHVLGRTVNDEDNLFESGLDSLQSIRIQSALEALLLTIEHVRCLGSHRPAIVVYRYPTISRVTNYVLSLLGNLCDSSGYDFCGEIDSAIERFSDGLCLPVGLRNGTALPRGLNLASAVSAVYLLTGTTGSIMSHVLSYILEDEKTRKVYCLVRSAPVPPLQRHLVSFSERGLSPEILLSQGDRLIFLIADLGQNDFGLEPQIFNELQITVTEVVHGAWYLNFNLSLESFERTHVAGVRRLIDFCLSAVYHPRLHFLSSIAVVANVPPPVSEVAFLNPNAPLQQGYAQSKYVAERLIGIAASEAGLNGTVIRCGQISGSTRNGSWSRTENIPILLESSALLGMVPDDLPDVHWLPVDVAGRALLKIIQKAEPGLHYYHVDNPTATSWTSVVDAGDMLVKKCMKHVNLQEWLKVAGRSDSQHLGLPAAKLLPFFEDLARRGALPRLDVTKTKEVAADVEYGVLDEQVLLKYVQYAVGR